MALAPIALFIYRRPEHTRRTLQSLLAAPELSESPLYIFGDGAKGHDDEAPVRATRQVARQLAPPSAIFVEQTENQGLARSIIKGVTELTQQYRKVIVIEDDLELSPSSRSISTETIIGSGRRSTWSLRVF